jgi:hypothetical protein
MDDKWITLILAVICIALFVYVWGGFVWINVWE